MSDKAKNPIYIEKWRLAQVLKISPESLRKLLNRENLQQLQKLNYQTRQHRLFRHQLDYLFPEGIDFEFE
jgi:hypothetical protein